MGTKPLQRTQDLKVPKEKVLFRVAIGEGRKRKIREIYRQLGLPVVRIGILCLGNLKPRQWRHLTKKEVEELKRPVK